METEFDLYLASQSPRRRELLNQVGISFQTLSIDVDESLKSHESADEYVKRLALEKATQGWFCERVLENKPVLGADTAVVINGQILGKPKNYEHALEMLTQLSDNTHQVMSAVAIAKKCEFSTQPELSCVISVSNVTFKKLSHSEIKQYWKVGESDDKAGAYAIQGKAAGFISHISGSYSGVMGLPLYETVELLQQAGICRDSLVVS